MPSAASQNDSSWNPHFKRNLDRYFSARLRRYLDAVRGTVKRAKLGCYVRDILGNPGRYRGVWLYYIGKSLPYIIEFPNYPAECQSYG
jgi:hypothetical protein